MNNMLSLKDKNILDVLRFVRRKAKVIYLSGFLRFWGVSKKVDRKPTILFFFPDAGVELFYTTGAFLAKTLMELKHNVLITQCFHLYKRCPVYVTNKFTPNTSEHVREKKCYADCFFMSEKISKFYNLKTINLNSFITNTEWKEINKILNSAPYDLRNYKYDDISFGMLVMKDMVLQTKVSSFEKIDEENRKIWLELIQSAIVSYIISKRIFKKYNITSVITYNLYANSLGMSIVANKMQIPVSVIANATHRNYDFRRIWIAPEKNFYDLNDPVIEWDKWKELPLKENICHEIFGDLENQINSVGTHHRYSPPKSGFKKNGFLSEIKKKYDKIIVAYTSSVDEALATKYLLKAKSFNDSRYCIFSAFNSQIEWLSETIKYCAEKSNYCLIVRIHPRVGQNRFENILSDQYFELKSQFNVLPENCIFIWPEDKISSYDLAEMSDITLVSWSSIGLDIARTGNPVITYTNEIPTFPNDDSVVFHAKSKNEYFNAINKFIQEDTYRNKIDRIRYALRWFHLQRLACCIDFSDVLKNHQYYPLPEFVVSQNAKIAENVICYGKNIFEQQYDLYKKNYNKMDDEKELKIIKMFLDENNVSQT